VSKVIQKRITAAVLLGALAIATAAPAAEAGHKYRASHSCGRHCSHGVVKRVKYVQPAPVITTVHHHHSSAAPAIAFIGGLVIGSVIANAHAEPAYVEPYSYWDPYCEARFVSLDAYHAHFGHHHHPRVVRVIEVHSGRWVDTYAWRDGGWRHCESW
jgi:hypothetical protein